MDSKENDQRCESQAISSAVPLEERGNNEYIVTFNNQSCIESYLFCENSGWGDEEASVVCRSERNSTYGIGGKYLTSVFVFSTYVYAFVATSKHLS